MTHERTGDAVFMTMERANSELAALLYGSLVSQLLKDWEDIPTVNRMLEQLGVESGCRLVEEFLAKSQVQACNDFTETCQVIAKVGFRMFLGVSGDIVYVENQGHTCYVQIPYNPLFDFVQLPVTLTELEYGNFVCGVIRGALEQLQMRVQVQCTKDPLHGSTCHEYRIELVEVLKETFIDPDEP